MKRAEILETATKIVMGGRNKQYGEPEDNFAVIAEYWSTYLSQHNGGRVILLTPMDVAIMMALFKIGRITTAGELRRTATWTVPDTQPSRERSRRAWSKSKIGYARGDRGVSPMV